MASPILLQTLSCPPGNDPPWPPPLWMMRQAGRYLPEYRKIRAEAGSFLDLCYTPALAKEVTLQPIRRFGLDAAILFSDILVIPDALGRSVSFKAGVGPRLEPLQVKDIAPLQINQALERLNPVLEAVSDIRASLSPEIALIGFCGAPWTVATYMIAGQGEKDQIQARAFAHQYRKDFLHLLDVLSEISIVYLNAQIEAGANVAQVFDSWANALSREDFIDFCVKPMARIVAGVRAAHPHIPVIGFPKGANLHYERYIQETDVNCVGLDWTYPLDQARDQLAHLSVLQGNLDPACLLAGGAALRQGVEHILNALRGRRLIFNLGHGIHQKTPIEHVHAMINQVRDVREKDVCIHVMD